MTRDIDHERNDKIEAMVMMAALAALGLLVALAVSTSVTTVTDGQFQAAAPSTMPPVVPETAQEAAGIDGNGVSLQDIELR